MQAGEVLKEKGIIKISEAKNSKNTVDICGIIKSVKVIHTKKGTSMAFVKIFDETGEEELTIFPTIFADNFSIIEKNNIVVIKGHHEERNGEASFLVDNIDLLED